MPRAKGTERHVIAQYAFEGGAGGVEIVVTGDMDTAVCLKVVAALLRLKLDELGLADPEPRKPQLVKAG